MLFADPCTAGSEFFTDKNKCWNRGVAKITNHAPFCKCKCEDGFAGDFCEKSNSFVNLY